MNKTETPFYGNPFDPQAADPPAPREGFKLVRGLEMPLITRRSSYPFSELRLHDAIIFNNARELKNALQAARTYRKHSPSFKVSGRKIFRGQYAGKYAIIRVS